MDEGQIHRGRGLVDLIAGVTPTLVDWTNDPTDAADITDGDMSTFCTTGNKVAGSGWQYGYFEWDLGGFCDVMCGGVGGVVASAGAPTGFMEFWNGSAWIRSVFAITNTTIVVTFINHSARCSKVRLGIGSTTAATTTPNIREFHVWRL